MQGLHLDSTQQELMLEDFQVDVTCLVRNIIKPDDRPLSIVPHAEASLVDMHLLATADAYVYQARQQGCDRVIACSLFSFPCWFIFPYWENKAIASCSLASGSHQF